MHTIKLTSGREFQSVPSSSLLDSALLSGVPVPYSCKVGRCGVCKCKVLAGTTQALQAEVGLSEHEKAEGWMLSCVRSACADMTLEMEDLGNIVLPKAKTMPCRISLIERLASDVVRVVLRLPPSADFGYIPGQYVDVIGANGIRRSYSLASAFVEDKTLELHIRAVPNGVMSSYWFSHAQVNDLLRLNGPMGTFFLRNLAQVDLVFLATGTGIAPVKAILESLIEIAPENQPKSIKVFWGARTREELYFDVQSIPAGQQFIPVLSRPDPHWQGAVGYVQNVFLDSKSDLANTAVYACGSDAMIQSSKAVITQAGLAPSRFFSDAFVCSAAQ